MSRAKTNKARMIYLRTQLENLAKVDIKSQAPPLGLALDSEGRALVNFLGRDLAVDNKAVFARDGSPVPIDAQSVVAHYLASQGRADLTGEFVPIGRLTGIGVTSGSPSESLTKPLSNLIGPQYDLFAQAAPKIGGVHKGLSQAGAQAWDFGLPKLPARVEFFEADDEFEAEIKLLFDSTANRYVNYECLELYTMCIVVDLLMAAGLITDPDDCQNSFLS
ncbi:MAG: DUF3786 domain-containing protein [Deltaproteobacteria bacterium]|jgi:hypothetical protein|nr:DUF3786 domain-containing protein [Deltaproteobacteria bacterium]